MVNPVRLSDLATPFLAQKTAQQFNEFALDPSQGLTRRRYAWHTNNTLFDDTAFSSSNVPGAIEISTGTSGTDTARIRSAFTGRYQSHELAVPGQGVTINNAVQDQDNLTSLENGLVAIGAGWHEDSSGGWTVDSNNVKTFLGLKFDSEGTEAVCISNGEHVGGSPVKQENWNINSLDGHGKNNKPAEVLKPQNGYIYNQPYTWYNQGALFIGFIPPSRDRLILAHKFEVEGKPSLDSPNLPTTVIVDNNGDPASTTVEVGGMQFTRYGSGSSATENRVTSIARRTTGGTISSIRAFSNGAVDPRTTPGTPLIAWKRKTGVRDTVITGPEFHVEADQDIYLFIFDEFNPGSSLTGENFRQPHTPASGKETLIEVDTEATAYTPTTTSFRQIVKIVGGKDKTVGAESNGIDDRLPIDATRIITAVHDGTAADVNPLKINIQEGF